MVQNTREMLSGRRHNLFKTGTAAAALAAAVLSATFAYAQDAPVTLAQADAAPSTAPNTAANTERPSNQVSTFVGSLIPGFQLNARVNLAETYTTNATGTSANGNQDDWLTVAGLGLDIHDHSRRVSFDATYAGEVYYYASGSTPTQFTNDLQAMASIIAIPDYLNFIARAFAQPVILSNSGFTTASGITGPNGYRNSYGYSLGPDITFKLGDFAVSDTTATYGAAYFSDPSGISNVVIPGVAGPENITSRDVTEILKSGDDFNRLRWTAVGEFSETDRSQGLFSQKAAVVTFTYSLTPEVALLATGGYEAINNSLGLSKDLSGPVGMGGVELTLGPNFDLMVQAGEKFNSLSFLGSLRWNITATASLTGQATDTVSTPEGQLLNNLSSMTASLNGTLTTAENIYGNGSVSSLGSFNAQSAGSLSFTQGIARYQRVSFTFAEDYERDHVNATLYGQKLTELDMFFVGQPVTESWGMQTSYSHNITRDLTGQLGLNYNFYQELGGHAKDYGVTGEVDYTLGPLTNIYFRSEYLRRDSSTTLQNLSPFTGSLDDIRLTIGLNRQL